MQTQTRFSSLQLIAACRRSLLIAAAGSFLVTVAFAGKPAPPPSIDVTSIVHDQDTLGNNLLFQADDLNRISEATYTNIGSVTSGVLITGGWGLDLYNQVARTICLTFATVNGSVPIVQNGCYSANVQIYSRCFDAQGSEIAFLTIQIGNPETNCLFAFVFTAGKTKYKMAMGQSLQSSPAGGPTGLATVACNAASGTTCTSWTITPNSNALHPTVANLYSYGPSGKLEYLGQYYLTFRVDATNP